MTSIPDNATLLIIPLERQPPEGYNRVTQSKSCSGRKWSFTNPACRFTVIASAPHAPGDVLTGRTVKAVRAPVRLDEVTESDAMSSGINRYEFVPDDGFPPCWGFSHMPDDGKCGLYPSAVAALRARWESNPWVWIIELETRT